ncbi:HNH endonuclease [Mycoplasmatota bacterium]|nr:HNH endonuclease [Mycoplasmatota bacterium]
MLDTHSAGTTVAEDFKVYFWERNKFNKVKENDLFIYRRPLRSSEINGQFYFFGAGKIDKIKSVSGYVVNGIIAKPYSFREYILQSDLDDFKWEFKKKESNFANFFNQYGMNRITKNDFINLLELQQNGYQLESDEVRKLEIELYNKQQKGNYAVEDQIGSTKIRGAGQKIFANQVKTNYGFQCAITGIKTKDFLVASHIIPWSIDKENRLNPKNGICLSTLVDKAFDKGYITISNNGQVIISEAANKDQNLYELLLPYQDVKIKVKKEFFPNEDFLKWHRENLFKQ